METQTLTDTEICGSRDLVRKLLKEATDLIIRSADEVGKLRHAHRKDVAYRYADAYLAHIMANLELTRIVMRKRKKQEKRVEVQPGDGNAPRAPLGEMGDLL